MSDKTDITAESPTIRMGTTILAHRLLDELLGVRECHDQMLVELEDEQAALITVRAIERPLHQWADARKSACLPIEVEQRQMGEAAIATLNAMAASVKAFDTARSLTTLTQGEAASVLGQVIREYMDAWRQTARRIDRASM